MRAVIDGKTKIKYETKSYKQMRTKTKNLKTVVPTKRTTPNHSQILTKSADQTSTSNGIRSARYIIRSYLLSFSLNAAQTTRLQCTHSWARTSSHIYAIVFHVPGQYCLLTCINTSNVPDESALCGGMSTLKSEKKTSCINLNINKSTHTLGHALVSDWNIIRMKEFSQFRAELVL